MHISASCPSEISPNILAQLINFVLLVKDDNGLVWVIDFPIERA